MVILSASHKVVILQKADFEKSNVEVAVDLGLRTIMFRKKGSLHVPGDTKEVLITQTIAYGTEAGYKPKRNKKGELLQSQRGAFTEPGSIHMYPTQGGYVLAISTENKDSYSHISIHRGLPISGFEEELESSDLERLLDGPKKLTAGLGINREIAEMIRGKPIYNNEMIGISDDKVPGKMQINSKFTTVSPDAVAIFTFYPER